MMRSFHITRIHCPQGIFQVHGQHNKNDIEINKLQMMGCDGWVALSINSAQVTALIKELKPQLLHHLNELSDITY